mgnify:CR=1 FL=1
MSTTRTRPRPAGIPEHWPAAITPTADLPTLINNLVGMGRTWHFDDNPADVINAHGTCPFDARECAHLSALMRDCDALGGVWKMMEDEPSQACHKALGLLQPEND